MLNMFVSSVQTDWDVYLPRMLFAYRAAYQSTMCDSPFFCLFGHDPVQPLDIVFANQDPPWKSDDLPQWRRKQFAWFQETRRLVESHLIQGQNRSATATDEQKKVDFQPADSVWLYQYFRKLTDENQKRIKKLTYNWHGPYRIHSRQGENTFRIYLPSHPDRAVPNNVDRLKKFQGYWSRPYDDDIPERLLCRTPSDDDWSPAFDEGDPNDALLASEFLLESSFGGRVQFPDGDLAYTNVESPISKVSDKRKRPNGESEYLVEHADGLCYWTPRSRLTLYVSFITEYENTVRAEKGLPSLRRSLCMAEVDTEPSEVFEF
ncbi:hypothetical protein AaE_014048 [Aphanomyces astaci]|uniref:Uncharacterized protein n=1 Tax=Aphanomyces astaci TaxID=112090 RepID=A0A6A4Z7N8_APHAT|nr:hypothetical protein AaE_014048 [Aphanomyces astaci]